MTKNYEVTLGRRTYDYAPIVEEMEKLLKKDGFNLKDLVFYDASKRETKRAEKGRYPLSWLSKRKAKK